MAENKGEHFTNYELEKAIARLSLMPYFPAEPGTRAALKDELIAMCPHREALEWLVTTCVTQVAKWPGPSEVRGLLCTHYPPADGISAACTLAGFRGVDYEKKSIDEHEALKVGSWSDDALKLLEEAGNHDFPTDKPKKRLK